MAGASPLPRRAHQRHGVDAPMLVEALVLVGAQQRHIARIDLVDTRRQAPLAVGGGEGAQNATVLVRDDGGAAHIARQIGRRQAVAGDDDHCDADHRQFRENRDPQCAT